LWAKRSGVPLDTTGLLLSAFDDSNVSRWIILMPRWFGLPTHPERVCLITGRVPAAKRDGTEIFPSTTRSVRRGPGAGLAFILKASASVATASFRPGDSLISAFPLAAATGLRNLQPNLKNDPALHFLLIWESQPRQLLSQLRCQLFFQFHFHPALHSQAFD